MSDRPARRGFAARPSDADRWIRSPDRGDARPLAETFPARLTIDVSAEMRGRIKIAAFQRGQTVADMLRALFEREFPPSIGDAP